MGMTHDKIVTMMAMARPAVSDEFALQTVDVFPQWESIINKEITQDDLNKGYDRYQYNGELYQVVQPHTPQEGWTPDVTPALWKKVSLEEWPEWIQPTGVQDAYNTGDKVMHNHKKWVSDVDANTWEPGVYGWNEVE